MACIPRPRPYLSAIVTPPFPARHSCLPPFTLSNTCCVFMVFLRARLAKESTKCCSAAAATASPNWDLLLAARLVPHFNCVSSWSGSPQPTAHNPQSTLVPNLPHWLQSVYSRCCHRIWVNAHQSAALPTCQLAPHTSYPFLGYVSSVLGLAECTASRWGWEGAKIEDLRLNVFKLKLILYSSKSLRRSLHPSTTLTIYSALFL